MKKEPRGIEALVEMCRDLHEDVDLSAVRRWKEQGKKRVAVGYLPIYIPCEILHAVGVLPVGIIGGGDRTDIIRGDAYFQSYICRIPRSTVELGLKGKLDVLDGMLFPAVCDVIRNLSGIWQILFPERLVRFVDFPQNFSREVGGKFYADTLRSLAGDLSALTGIPLEDGKLARSVSLYNENRDLIRDLHALRAESPEQVPTYEAYLVQRAGHLIPVEEHNALLTEYLGLARARREALQDNARIVLVGAFCEQPPLALIKSLELAGCYIVDDDFLLGNRTLLQRVGTEGDPLTNLVESYLDATVACSSVYDRNNVHARDLVERVESTRADGVVFAAPSFCDPALLDRPRYAQALEAAGIPSTAFKYAENTGQLGAIREQVGTFAESIRLWGKEALAGDIPGEPNMTEQKEASMVLQKEMLAGYFDEVASARERGKKVVYTFVPGNLTELIRSFDLIPIYPEINALQNGMRKRSDDYIAEAERFGYSEDVCTYVKCDVGMMLQGNVGPTGKPLPPPDLLLLSYTGCFVFMKWFENLKALYDCPAVMLHVPYQAEGEITPDMRDYVVDQIKSEVIPALEKVSGNKFDETKLRDMLARSAKAEDGLVNALESARHKPSPIDAYFGAVYYVGPIFTAFRGTEDAIRYYDHLGEEIAERVRLGLGPVTPGGPMKEQRYRLVVEGPPNWTHFRDFWKLFYDMGAVTVASSYTKVGGLYDRGFRHDPERPFETLAEYCMGCYTNLSLPARTDLLAHYVESYDADGFLIHSVKSCNSFSAGQLLILRQIEERTGRPGGFIESDLVDSRYFSAANLKNRLESYLQMIDQKRGGVVPV